MNCYIACLKYIIKHKCYVFVECCKLGVPIRGLLHDISKLFPSEFIPNARFIHKKDRSPEMRTRFLLAKTMHIHRNRHHPQYWWVYDHKISRRYQVDIPVKYLKEIVADWKGCQRANGAKRSDAAKRWYLKCRDTFNLSVKSKEYIESLLGIEHFDSISSKQPKHIDWKNLTPRGRILTRLK